MKTLIKKTLEKAGLKIIRYPEEDLSRRIQLFQSFRINKILDVGANEGQYALQMRKLGFSGKLISFEPLVTAFSKLKKRASRDKNWEVHNFALGNEETSATINIASNLYSSSLLDMMPAHLESAPQSSYKGIQEVSVQKLDSIFDTHYKTGDELLLKIDTQGFEKNVLEGAEHSLPKIRGVQVEMSIVELYRGELLFDKMIAYLKSRGFELYSLENGFYNKSTGRLLQVDGIFFRP